MARRLQLRRGTTSQHSAFIGAIGEVTVDTDKDTLIVHDGVTQGGKALATEQAINSVNLLRADKYLANQTVAKLIYNASCKVEKVRYVTDTDTDYEVLSYTNGKLTNVAHYIGGVLKGNTSLNYINLKLVSAPFTAV